MVEKNGYLRKKMFQKKKESGTKLTGNLDITKRPNLRIIGIEEGEPNSKAQNIFLKKL